MTAHMQGGADGFAIRPRATRRYGFCWMLLLVAAIAASPPARVPKQDPGFFPIVQDGKWGFIDRTGKVIVPPRYERTGDVHEGLVQVWEDGASHFIDTHGQTVPMPPFDVIGEFSEGVAPLNRGQRRDANLGLLLEPGWWGYVDVAGRFVTPMVFTYADPFHDWFAAAKRGDESGFINHWGQWVFKADFDAAWGFQDGFALLRSGDAKRYVDRQGNVLATAVFDDAEPFSEGRAAVRIGERWGYLDDHGQLAIPPRFLDAGEFHDGLAPVAVAVDPALQAPCTAGDSSWRAARKTGFIDRRGEFVIGPAFDGAGPFSEERASVSVCDRVGFVDTTGKLRIALRWDDAFAFHDGVAAVRVFGEDGMRYGWIDRWGKTIWEPSR